MYWNLNHLIHISKIATEKMSNELKYDRKHLKIGTSKPLISIIMILFILAIIGAGIGGCSCAYFLSNLFQNQVEIDIYEKSNVIGGRIKSFEYDGKEYEYGATNINPHNL